METGTCVFWGISVLLLVLGYCVKCKKAYWLISGYNTMSPEKKKNVDTKALGAFIGNMMFIMAAIIFCSGILMLLDLKTVGIIVSLLIIPVSGYILIGAQRFDGNNFKENGSMKKGAMATVGLSKVFTALILVGVGILLFLGSRQAGYTIENGMLGISGMYGQKIPIENINNLELRETLPTILRRTNGAAIGSKLKGHFNLEEVGKAKLFIDKAKPPFIYVESDSGIVIFNFNDSDQTKEFYEQLKEEWQKD